MWFAPWICALVAVAVELLKAFAFNTNARRDELRLRIASLRVDVRGYNPQTEYGTPIPVHVRSRARACGSHRANSPQLALCAPTAS